MSATGLMENEGNRPGRLSVLTMPMGMQVTMSDDSSRTERIRQQAYLMWLEEGRPEGGDAERWELARQTVDHMDRLVEKESRRRARVDPGQKDERIQARAYRIWLDEGRPEGKYLEHWERAKAEVEEELAMTEGDQELKQAQ